MGKVSPRDIVDRFPIGKAIELSLEVRGKLAFLADVQEGMQSVTTKMRERYGPDGIPEDKKAEAQAFLESLYVSHPFETFLSSACAESWQNPFAAMLTGGSQTVVEKISAAVIFSELCKYHGFNLDIYRVVRLSMVNAPRVSAVVVSGHQFSGDDLGLSNVTKSKEVCPDHPPMDFFKDLEGDTK